MKMLRPLAVLVIGLSFALPAFAGQLEDGKKTSELYKWFDDNGGVHFSDSEIEAQQKGKKTVKTHIEVTQPRQKIVLKIGKVYKYGPDNYNRKGELFTDISGKIYHVVGQIHKDWIGKYISDFITTYGMPVNVLPVTPDTIDVQSSQVQKATPEIAYTGTRISLDFQKADIHNILKIIADVAGLNIIASDKVKCLVTIKLLNVPWDQALDDILNQNGLDMTMDGNVIRIGTVEEFSKKLKR